VNEEELIRKLNSVGKEKFVTYFDLFRDYSNGNLSREACIERLVVENVSNENGASIRCSNAKKIFDEGMSSDALEVVASSRKIHADIRNTARERLLEQVDD